MGFKPFSNQVKQISTQKMNKKTSPIWQLKSILKQTFGADGSPFAA